MVRRPLSPSARGALRRVLGWPARRLLDRRVEWVLSALDERIGNPSNRPSLQRRLDLLEAELQQVNAVLGESVLDRRLASLAGQDQLVLPADTARFLNWAEGHTGPAARAELWFNPPVALEYADDEVRVLLVNERIVEHPYVFSSLARAGLPRPARILDVGGAESTVALSLASFGHDVHVVDPRGYRLEHPRVSSHALPLAQLPPGSTFDAAVALSSIEHFGLGAYGESPSAARLDRAALADMNERLAGHGVLVLTVPCAPTSGRDAFQRTYSFPELREMLAGWDVLDLSVAWRQDHLTWVRGDPEDPLGPVGVAMVTARKRL